MSDERLDSLRVSETKEEYSSPIRISKIKLVNYKFFHGEFELPVGGENLLIYGENGSGKSSIYRALELLTRDRIDNLAESLNIFSEGEVEVEFGFTNGTEYTITVDTEELPDYVDFLKGLSVFSPMLDYKKLLKVHYSGVSGSREINLYGMLRQLLSDYPLAGNRVLSDVKDFAIYFAELEKIVNKKLLNDINRFINTYFDKDFCIDSFICRQEIVDDVSGAAEPIVTMQIGFKDKPIRQYHTFLNEARLSALAISIYFASIKKLIGVLEKESIKLLVLDDLLISLDMSNRLKLLNILKEQFADFQIFFFTHDKELFELYKNKMSWKKYELYLDDSEDIHKPLLKLGTSETERAKEFFAKKEYDCCALLLRKGFEKILKSYLSPREQLDKNCNELDLAKLVDKAISKSAGENKAILEKLNVDRRHILNPLSHNDNRPVYSEELKQAMTDLEKLKELLK